jgi:hypothetical protein
VSSIAFHFIPPIKTKRAFFHVKLPIFTISPLLFTLHSKTTSLIQYTVLCVLNPLVFVAMASPREHIEHIRKTTFSIGGEKNPLAPMLDQAVKYLSAELYTKDVHFLMELIRVFLSFLHFFIVLVLLNYLFVQ